LISSVFYKYRSFFFELKKVLITSSSLLNYQISKAVFSYSSVPGTGVPGRGIVVL
jgi:hypothetical protein